MGCWASGGAFLRWVLSFFIDFKMNSYLRTSNWCWIWVKNHNQIGCLSISVSLKDIFHLPWIIQTQRYFKILHGIEITKMPLAKPSTQKTPSCLWCKNIRPIILFILKTYRPTIFSLQNYCFTLPWSLKVCPLKVWPLKFVH